ncbi:hypothetical protein GCM10007933_02600 [Zoogloea oryzae]|uniref:Uncharacterized protein n=1 Tax=Zoogloea oryzae TaxID=310767 RepID=A0ABQ6F5H8_9RHOO|nr:hypothetical protein [Zoogloea oryzae]GLT20808.1 hypothetical protein GCM10007933_02600 [Zoogloea oryzae]
MNNTHTLGELLAVVTVALIALLLTAATVRALARRLHTTRTSDRDGLREKVVAARFERHIRARLKSRSTPPTANPGPGMRPHPCRSLADAVHARTPSRPWIIPPADLPDPFPAKPGETVSERAKRTAKAREEAPQ